MQDEKPAITTITDLISAAAEEMKVNVFHRFALMRHWHEVKGKPFPSS